MIIKSSTYKYFPWRIRHLFNFHLSSSVNGKAIIVPLKGNNGLETHWTPGWKTDVVKALCNLGDGVFVDIGANIGQTLIDHFVSETATRYVGFEPNPTCINYLNDLIKSNSLSQYMVLPIGLAGEAKLLPLYSRVGIDEDDCATTIKGLAPKVEVVSQYVPCYDFDYVRENLGLERIGLIKIDVEGGELEVLKGMRKTLETLQPTILCEVLFTDANAEHTFNTAKNKEIMQILNDFDYKVWQIIKSADDSRVADAEPIEAFETAFYSDKTRNLCDYLFVPSANQTRVINTLVENKRFAS